MRPSYVVVACNISEEADSCAWFYKEANVIPLHNAGKLSRFNVSRPSINMHSTKQSPEICSTYSDVVRRPAVKRSYSRASKNVLCSCVPVQFHRRYHTCTVCHSESDFPSVINISSTMWQFNLQNSLAVSAADGPVSEMVALATSLHLLELRYCRLPFLIQPKGWWLTQDSVSRIGVTSSPVLVVCSQIWRYVSALANCRFPRCLMDSMYNKLILSDNVH